MLESALSALNKPSRQPGVITGVYEAQPIIASGDFNFLNVVGSLVRVGDYLYIGPGNISSGGSYNLMSNFYRYNLKTFKLEQLSTCPKAVSFATMCHDNGKLYLYAGIPASGSNSPLCVYDIASGTWVNTGTASQARKNCRAFVYNGRLYTVGGGLSTGGVYYDVISYDLNDYSSINHGNFLNQTGAGYLFNEGAGVLIGSKFYFSRGGNSSNDAWMVFDAAKLTLTVLTMNPAAVAGGSPVLFGDKIVMRNGNTSISIYDTLTDKWTVIPAQTNTSYSGNGQSAHFEYDNSLWTKQLNANDTTLRRFWRIN